MLEQFANDVSKGLSYSPKKISSKYFYNKEGDMIFQEIMAMNEYYPTDCEYEILRTYNQDMLEYFYENKKEFDFIELGAGDGKKTKILLKHFVDQKVNFSYYPIDISCYAVNNLKKDIGFILPKLKVKRINREYLEGLEEINSLSKNRKVILFLGSNIGNMTYDEGVLFLKSISLKMKKNDFLLIGFDLQKDPLTILNAYNDKQGITARFNLNLLSRINKDLGGDFNVNQFYHYPVYDPHIGEAKSYIVSKVSQDVHVSKLDKTFHFKEGEVIYTEISKKYSIQMIENMSKEAGFEIKNNFIDKRQYFTNSLWIKT
jgi:L-histidine Nalpha-methyltransferase